MIEPSYPETFPMEAAKLVVDKLRGQGVPLTSLVHACWVMTGYSLSVTLPEPQVVGSAEITDEIAADYLECLMLPPVSMAAMALPWKLLAGFLAKKLIEWILENQSKG